MNRWYTISKYSNIFCRTEEMQNIWSKNIKILTDDLNNFPQAESWREKILDTILYRIWMNALGHSCINVISGHFMQQCPMVMQVAYTMGKCDRHKHRPIGHSLFTLQCKEHPLIYMLLGWCLWESDQCQEINILLFSEKFINVCTASWACKEVTNSLWAPFPSMYSSLYWSLPSFCKTVSIMSSVGTPDYAKSSSTLTKSSISRTHSKVLILPFKPLIRTLLIMVYQRGYLRQANHNTT
jgi:hypothetical protein